MQQMNAINTTSSISNYNADSSEQASIAQVARSTL